jgi:hypothetical protein
VAGVHRHRLAVSVESGGPMTRPQGRGAPARPGRAAPRAGDEQRPRCAPWWVGSDPRGPAP